MVIEPFLIFFFFFLCLEFPRQRCLLTIQTPGIHHVNFAWETVRIKKVALKERTVEILKAHRFFRRRPVVTG